MFILSLVVARKSIYDVAPTAVPGEVSPAIVPVSLIRGALAVAGGSSPVPTRAGGVADAVTGGYAGGVATGDDVAALWGTFGEGWTGYEWQYNYDGPSPFIQHEDLGVSAVRFTDWSDSVLSTAGTGAEWVGDFFFPGDHYGCQCDAVPVFPGD